MESYSVIDKESLEHYTCAICLEIFGNPYLIAHCLHIFCLDCINKFIDYNKGRSQILECPICRSPFKKEDLIQDPSVLQHIDTIIIKCFCQKKVKLVNYNLHIRSYCSDFYELDNSEYEKIFKKNFQKYTCPCCLSNGFDSEMIVSHILNDHQAEEGICPLCSVSNKNEKNTSNLNNFPFIESKRIFSSVSSASIPHDRISSTSESKAKKHWKYYPRREII